MLQAESRLRQSDRVLTQQAADTMVLLSLHSGQYYELNEVGYAVWELCDGSKRIDEIITIIGETYAAPVDAVRVDVMELLQDLVAEKLLLLPATP